MTKPDVNLVSHSEPDNDRTTAMKLAKYLTWAALALTFAGIVWAHQGEAVDLGCPTHSKICYDK